MVGANVTLTSAEGSDRSQRCTGKLSGLAHSQVISASLTVFQNAIFILKHRYLSSEKHAFFSFRRPVFIQEISGRFDVGNLSSYIECDLYFREKLQNVDSYMV